jgi:hypothetical protein
MAGKDVDTIVNDVLTCIDEIAENDSEWLKEQDAEEMNSVIKSKIYDAVRFVFLNADIGLLELSWKTGTESATNNVVKVALDNDVLRVCYAKLDGWVRPLSEPIVYTDKEYASLRNPITTGYPDNPKMAINVTPKGKQLELYGVETSSAKYDLGYMPEPIEENGTGDNSGKKVYGIPGKLYRGVVYYTAGLTLLTYKDSHADSLLNQAIQMIGAK